MVLHTCIMICTQITILPTTSRSFQGSQRIVLPGRHAFTVENIFAILKRTVHEVLKVKWYHSLRPAEAILRAQRRTDIERKVKWRDIVDPVCHRLSTGDVECRQYYHQRNEQFSYCSVIAFSLVLACTSVVVLIITKVVHQVSASVSR